MPNISGGSSDPTPAKEVIVGLPAGQPDNAAQPQPRHMPKGLPPSRRGARAAARRGGGGETQPPLLVSTHLLSEPPPSPAHSPAKSDQERREEARTLLAVLGVRKAYLLARDYEPAHIEGWVAAWQEDRNGGADIGPGALAVRIEQWGPPPAPQGNPKHLDTEADWLERRYKRGKARGEGSLR